MANIDDMFNVPGISLDDRCLISSTATDPSVVGYEAPIGSVLAHTTTGEVYRKIGPADTNWLVIPSPDPAVNPEILYRETSELVQVGAGPFAVLQFTIPANTLAVGDIIRCHCRGLFDRPSSGNNNLTAASVFGGTTLFSDAVGLGGTTTRAFSWDMEFAVVSGTTTAALCRSTGLIMIGNANPVVTGVRGDIGSSQVTSSAPYVGNTATLDLTSPLTVTASVSWSLTDAITSVFWRYIEKI